MKQVVQVKLLADAGQVDALVRTLSTANAAATKVSRIAYAGGACTRRMSFRQLQKLAYTQAKNAGLSAQPALLTISKVAACYATLRTNLRNGRYGRKGSARRVKVEDKPVTFRPLAAQPFDDRCLSWQHSPGPVEAGHHAGTVSIWTVDGRVKNIAFIGHPGHIEKLRRYRRGETDLVIRPGKHGRLTAYLLATLDIPEPDVADGPHLDTAQGWIGVDLGVDNIAVASDRPLAAELIDCYGGGAVQGPAGQGSVKDRRTRNRELRTRLQKKGTKSAKRLLKRRARKEARFAADVNHQIAKRIVAEAERTGRGIACEELTGIRARVRLRKSQRATHASWAFAQLGRFLEYKARRAGVPFVQVDPAHTSQRCTACGHTDRRNRPTQAEFICRSCGFTTHADVLGSDNIALRAPETYRAQSTVPSAA